MVVELKKPITKDKIEQLSLKLTEAKSAKKPFDATLFGGTINWGASAIDIQKQMRDEWR